MSKQTSSNDSGWYVLSGQRTIVHFKTIPQRMSLSVIMRRAWTCLQIVQQIEMSARSGKIDEMISLMQQWLTFSAWANVDFEFLRAFYLLFSRGLNVTCWRKKLKREAFWIKWSMQRMLYAPHKRSEEIKHM